MRSILFFILSICLLIFYSCKTVERTSANESSANQWLDKNLADRFADMHVGLFKMCDSLGEKTRLMKSGDSLYLYGHQFGDKNKNGAWIYQKMYMSGLENDPLSLDLLNIKKVSIDSFVVLQYQFKEAVKAKYITADENPKILNKVSMDNLELIACDIRYSKLNQLKFEGATDICTIDFGGGHSQTFSNTFWLSPKGLKVKTRYYSIEGKDTIYKSKGDAYFVRTADLH